MGFLEEEGLVPVVLVRVVYGGVEARRAVFRWVKLDYGIPC